MPQSVPPDSQWAAQWPDPELRDQWVHRLANLVLLTQRRNAQAQNYDFAKKKKIYFSGRQNVTSYVLTSQVLSENAWTPNVVQARQKRLLKTLAENWAYPKPLAKQRDSTRNITPVLSRCFDIF